MRGWGRTSVIDVCEDGLSRVDVLKRLLAVEDQLDCHERILRRWRPRDGAPWWWRLWQWGRGRWSRTKRSPERFGS